MNSFSTVVFLPNNRSIVAESNPGLPGSLARRAYLLPVPWYRSGLVLVELEGEVLAGAVSKRLISWPSVKRLNATCRTSRNSGAAALEIMITGPVARFGLAWSIRCLKLMGTVAGTATGTTGESFVRSVLARLLRFSDR